jgi:hypothetical protein
VQCAESAACVCNPEVCRFPKLLKQTPRIKKGRLQLYLAIQPLRKEDGNSYIVIMKKNKMAISTALLSWRKEDENSYDSNSILKKERWKFLG